MPVSLDKRSGTVSFIGLVQKDTSRIIVFPEFCKGIEGLENYSHVIILYWFHQRDNPKERCTLQVIPKRHAGAPQIGVFASRSPSRPNPIGLCVAELIGVEKCILTVKGLDADEGSPIIDIKPYLPKAESIPDARTPYWAQSGPLT
ncbi:MAG: tRNA (N6-threonylcarbamoyladenosine(37)-N6)-methyltransferase TrmO [Promethearchaeati archaeon SRVP18_Atabeyarchaeia-1]